MTRLGTPSETGAHSEAAVTAALVGAGFRVYVPMFGINGRVDLIYERPGQLVRVQCKTARLTSDGALFFHTVSQTNNVPATYHGEIDEFGVYAPRTNMVYLVPFPEVPTRSCTLRVDPPRNGQVSKIRWARDYELGPPGHALQAIRGTSV